MITEHAGTLYVLLCAPPLPVSTMSETSALKFQQAYDEARTSITSSLNSVKDTYEGIQRDLGNEIKASNLEKKELTASLNEANNKIEGLNGVITGLETSLSASKELAATTQKTLEVRTGVLLGIFVKFFLPPRVFRVHVHVLTYCTTEKNVFHKDCSL